MCIWSSSPVLVTQLLKPLESLNGEHLLYATEMTGSWGFLDSFSLGNYCILVSRCELLECLESWNFQFHPLSSGEWGEGLEFENSHLWPINQLCLRNKTSIKPLTNEAWRASGLVNTLRHWGNGTSRETVDTPCAQPLSSYTSLWVSSVWLLLWYKPVTLSKVISCSVKYSR